ncbi:MAG: hypothetical protein HY231_14440 [Acidobacteria bacterium]|nr:hypothetical protein [Acidobacteriota bacterium]
MVDLEIFSNKLDKDATRIMHLSYNKARSRNHNQLNLHHVTLAFAELEPDLFNYLLRSLHLDPVAIIKEAEARLVRQKGKGEEMELSNNLRTLLKNALKRTHGRGRRLIEARDLLLAQYNRKESKVKKLLNRIGVLRKGA